MATPFPFLRAGLCGAALLTLAACDNGRLDLDLRDNLGDAFDTSSAAQQKVDPRPAPDSRGIISYPGYQVAVAGRNDTVNAIAQRVGLPASEIATYNGLPTDVPLRSGEIVALPRRVAEPSPATGSVGTGPIRPATIPGGTVTTQTLDGRASDAITRAERIGVQTGPEPVRHKVARGETAFSISRLYDVPVKALAEWNGLDADLTVREGQYLLIPSVSEAAPRPEETTLPGAGSVAPVPPSAVEPLPDEEATQGTPEETPPSPDLASEATSESAADARLLYPVSGQIIRPFNKGRNDGIDISAAAGTPVKAADGGTVAAITRDTDQVPIVVLRHSGNLLTVYAGVDNVAVSKGETVDRGQVIAQIRNTAPSFLHFEVREGFDSVDPVDYLQ